MSVTCEIVGTGEQCEGLKETPIGKNIIIKNTSIESKQTHKYVVTITFKETNSDQNYNQGKNFTGTLGVNEYREITPVYCTYDGEMKQGATYTNGSYTYRYKLEFGIYNGTYAEETSSDTDNYNVTLLQGGASYGWNSLNNDGWGVILTDPSSTEDVTDKPCTFISDKPVSSMSYMFYGKSANLIDLSEIDTSNVTNMSHMFASKVYNIKGLEDFDTSNVTNMNGMFAGTNITTLDLSNFDTSKVTDMSSMFGLVDTPKIDISNFDTSNVTNMNSMFYNSNALELKGLDKINTSKVVNMGGMFSGSNFEKVDLSNLDTSNVVNMSGTFSRLDMSKVIGLNKINYSKVTDMSNIFSGIKADKFSFDGIDTSNVENMGYMFQYATINDLDLDSLDVSKCEDLIYMFYHSYIKNIDFSGVNLNSITNTGSMFYYSTVEVIDLSTFDTSAGAFMENMFLDCKNLKTIYASDKFTVNSSKDHFSDMFKGCTSLVGGKGTVFDSTKVNNEYARIDGGTSNPGYFTQKN